VFVLWELVYPQSLSVVRQYLRLKFSTPATSHQHSPVIAEHEEHTLASGVRTASGECGETTVVSDLSVGEGGM